MSGDLALVARLFVLLVGVSLYGFLVRELGRGRGRGRGAGLATRLLALSLFLWYAAALADDIIDVLAGDAAWFAAIAIPLDVGRGVAFLVSFPLLVQSVWGLVRRRLRPGPDELAAGVPPATPASLLWASPVVLLPAWASLLLFAPIVVAAWTGAPVPLADLASGIYGRFVVHASIALASATGVALVARGRTEPGVERRLLTWLLVTFAAIAALDFLGLALAAAPGGVVREAWILLSLVSGLPVGATFLYFVRRYNLLRLTLGQRSLRHFALVIGIVVVVLLSGPAVGAEGSDVYRRIVAWGLVLALAAGTVGVRLVALLETRVGWVRRLLGGVPAAEVEVLLRQVRELDRPEDALLGDVAAAASRWLGGEARFVAVPGGVAEQTLWRELEVVGRDVITRVDASPAALAALDGSGARAVLALRVGDALERVLLVDASASGVQAGDDLDAVALLLRHLETALHVRRSLDQRVALERQVAEGERLQMLGQVAASLAHELKNPLSAVKALTQTVREELAEIDPDSEAARDLGLVVEQVDRLDDTSREILGFARPPADGAVDLSALVRSVVAVLDAEARRRGLELRAEVEEVGDVDGSVGAWQTIVFNLVLNAVERSPASSGVDVRLALVGDAVRFDTRNAGPAIDPELAESLFEPYATSDGTGLGLALVARRARELGGTIELVNEPDRIVFRVRVPNAGGGEDE